MFCCSAPLWAQDTRYRVEILVLTHLKHNELPAEADRVSDYSDALDFLTPLPETEEPELAEDTAEAPGAAPGVGEPALLDEAGIPEEPDPNAVVHIEEMSDIMRESWRRLRLSAPFRPQQYLSWEQGNQEPFPILRVHDLQVMMVKDPGARERLKMIEADLLEDESEKRETLFVTAEGASPAQQSAGLVDTSGLPADQPGEPELPKTVPYYRLDGTVALRRSRFLHLDLDIQLREGTWEPEPLEIIAQDPIIFERAGPTAFMVHELQQSRQVKTERMEYFDGPVLSVLAYITSYKVTEGDPQ